MQKTILTCVLSSIALVGCGSGGKDKNSYQSNSQVEVVTPSQMTAVQQQQEFPQVLPRGQYAAATKTNAMPQTTMSDFDDDTNTQLSAMAAQPTSAQASEEIPSVSNPALPDSTITQSQAAPANANMPSTGNQQVAPASESGMPNQTMIMPATTNTTPVSTITVSTPAATMAEGTAPTDTANNQTTVMPASTNTMTGTPTQTNIMPASTAPVTNPNTMQSATLSNQTQAIVQSNNTAPVSEQYEALEPTEQAQQVQQEQQMQQMQQMQENGTTVTPNTNSYSNFDNVATPVTFTNSPYNQALKAYTYSTENGSHVILGPSTEQPKGGGAILANQPPPQTTTTTIIPANTGYSNGSGGTSYYYNNNNGYVNPNARQQAVSTFYNNHPNGQ